MRKTILGVVLLVCAVSLLGCVTTAIHWCQEGFGGPSFRLHEINPIVGSLDGYQRVEVLPFTNDVPHLAPEQTLARIAPEIAESLKKERLFLVVIAVPEATEGTTGVPTLVISGKVVSYDPGDRNERVFCMGGEAILTTRVILTDKQSGKVVGSAGITGVVQTTFKEADDTAWGVAKGVLDWLKANRSEAL